MGARIARQRQGKSRTNATEVPHSSEIAPAGESTGAERRWSIKESWNNFYAQHLTVELDNTKGSVARDHLANERTYLAWLRTSLSFASA